MSYEFADGYKIRDQNAPHFLTFTIEGWIDLFSRQVYRDIILASFRYCQREKGLAVGAYVIMTNHVHAIWTSHAGSLSDTIRDFKTHTSKAMMKEMLQHPGESRKHWMEPLFRSYATHTSRNHFFKVWTNDNHPEAVYSSEFLLTKLKYIHENPVRAGWVSKPEDYLYSSASNYAFGRGVFEVDLLY
jgi:REP element-mobilizing transposase RayT